MQTVDSRTNYQINASFLQNGNDFFTGETQSGFANNQPYLIRGEIILENSEFSFPVQSFTVSDDKTELVIYNQPNKYFPKVKFTATKDSSKVSISIRISDLESVESEIYFTRLLLALNESKFLKIQSNKWQKPFGITLENSFQSSIIEIRNRAKLFRKLKFIEKLFKIKFQLPNHISFNDVSIINVAFRGLTEGVFSNPEGDFFTIPNYQIERDTLEKPPFSKNGEFNYKFDTEELPIFGKNLSVGKISICIKKSRIANPRAIRGLKNGDIISSLKLVIFDYQVQYRFEKYANSERLLRNKQKLEQFKNELRKEESEFLVSLLDESLTEITEKPAIEIVTGWLQFYDFPDRYTVGEPVLEETQWRVPIWLTYPNDKGVWLEDAFVNFRTGNIEISSSAEELRKKGKKKAKEIFSVV